MKTPHEIARELVENDDFITYQNVDEFGVGGIVVLYDVLAELIAKAVIQARQDAYLDAARISRMYGNVSDAADFERLAAAQ